MFELKLESYSKPIKINTKDVHFNKPIIYYLVNKQDDRPFFITFVIIDYLKKELLYLFTYNEQNIRIVNEQPNNKRFSMEKFPHSTICINKEEDFFTFMEEEEFFFYVNYKKMIMKVYTMDDLIETSDIRFKRFSSTFYKDDNDPNFFFLSVVDTSDLLHIFRVSLTLDSVVEIDSFPSHPTPPHALRKHKDFLFLSHDFKHSRYELQKSGKIVNPEQLRGVINTNLVRILYSKSGSNDNQNVNLKSLSVDQTKELLDLIRNKHAVKCLPGEILLLDIKTKEKTYYNTTGGSPAHFEIDVDNDIIYTSSHNFFVGKDTFTFLEPAVIDKFKLTEGKLKLIGSFSYPKGYRYTSHRIFYYKGKPYLCTFGQPNRLIFIDAEKMELLFYQDIEKDELTNQSDVSRYINSRDKKFELVTIEVSEDGENILFVGPQYIYLYDFPKRKLYKKINYKSSTLEKIIFNFKKLLNIPYDKTFLDDYKIRTVHLNYLD